MTIDAKDSTLVLKLVQSYFQRGILVTNVTDYALSLLRIHKAFNP